MQQCSHPFLQAFFNSLNKTISVLFTFAITFSMLQGSSSYSYNLKKWLLKNVESMFSGKEKYWKDLELYWQVQTFVHAFSCFLKTDFLSSVFAINLVFAIANPILACALIEKQRNWSKFAHWSKSWKHFQLFNRSSGRQLIKFFQSNYSQLYYLIK